MEKQIEEMAKIITDADPYKNCKGQSCLTCKFQDIEKNCYCAVALYKAGYRKASEVAREIINEIDNALHDMAMEYANAGHSDYFAVCEMVHHKVIRPFEKKYESEGEE